MDSTTSHLLPVDANGHGPELSDRYTRLCHSLHALDQQNYNDPTFYTPLPICICESATGNHTAGPALINTLMPDTSGQPFSFTDFLNEGWTADGYFDLNSFLTPLHQLPPGEGSQETVATSPPVGSSNRNAIAPPLSGPQPGQQEWEARRGLLERLYRQKTAGQIANIMAREYDFHASETQYRAKFKKWRFSKYQSRDAKRKMIQIKNWRKMKFGKDTEFFVDNQRVPEEKLARHIRTHGNPALEQPGPIPDWLDCRTPPPPPSFQREERRHPARAPPPVLAPDDPDASETLPPHEPEPNPPSSSQHRASRPPAADHGACPCRCFSRGPVSRSAVLDGAAPVPDTSDSSLVADDGGARPGARRFRPRPSAYPLRAWQGGSLLDRPWSWSSIGEQQASETRSPRADLLRERMRSLGYPAV